VGTLKIKIPIGKLDWQRCKEEFNSGFKGLMKMNEAQMYLNTFGMLSSTRIQPEEGF
jgi:hypothetical protein